MFFFNKAVAFYKGLARINVHRSYSTELRSGQDSCRETLKGPTIDESLGDYIPEHEILGSDGLSEVGECSTYLCP